MNAKARAISRRCSRSITREENIHEVLNPDRVREALKFFAEVPRLTEKLRVLDEVGLGYLRLGQSATNAIRAEAEAQRMYSLEAAQPTAGNSAAVESGHSEGRHAPRRNAPHGFILVYEPHDRACILTM